MLLSVRKSYNLIWWNENNHRLWDASSFGFNTFQHSQELLELSSNNSLLIISLQPRHTSPIDILWNDNKALINQRHHSWNGTRKYVLSVLSSSLRIDAFLVQAGDAEGSAQRSLLCSLGCKLHFMKVP